MSTLAWCFVVAAVASGCTLFGWYVGFRVAERSAPFRDEMQEGG